MNATLEILAARIVGWLGAFLLVAASGLMACGDDDGGTTDSVEPADTGSFDLSGADTTPPDTEDDGPICGDGFCELSEDINCPLDCGCSCDVDFDCSANCACDPECGPEECFIARCENGTAVTCDGEASLDCNSFGASCETFVDVDTNQPFSWCGCGSLPEGGGQCFDSDSLAVCDNGVALPGSCPEGTECVADGSTLGCGCDDAADGICPDDTCTSDPDCSLCVPSCGSAECGDNGCGGSCGECSLGDSCNAGFCESSCTPSCAGRECGSDGCGGTCGSCAAPETCNSASGLCEGECVPSCEVGQTCGSDGCGGECGSPCPANRECRDCPSGATCAVDTYTCRCDFFSSVDYLFDASGLDWTNINAVTLNYQHVNLDGTLRPKEGVFLTAAETTRAYSPPGCEPMIEVKREYSINGGGSCVITETLTQASIVVPQPILTDGGGCTAPPIQ